MSEMHFFIMYIVGRGRLSKAVANDENVGVVVAEAS